jgi:hypothetical protein
MFLFVSGAFAQFGGGPSPKEAKKDGWWIKAEKDARPVIYIGESSHSFTLWKMGMPGDPEEYDVPAEFRNTPTIYILAQTPAGIKTRFNLMYKSKCVTHFDFDLEESHESKQSDEDKDCK